jgi:siroheme synthase-like protein
LLGEGPGADARAARLAAAGAEVARLGAEADPDALTGYFAVVIHPEGPPTADHERAAQVARARGCLVYLHDRPEVSDFAMPAISRRGPLQIAISTDAVAPALARRLREELDRVVTAAGRALDALLDRLEARRAELPAERRGELYKEASRLRIEGQITVDED